MVLPGMKPVAQQKNQSTALPVNHCLRLAAEKV